MSQAIMLPDELYQKLADYAAQQAQTPEEVLATLVRRLAPSEAAAENASTSYPDPWEGFYGAFESSPS